MATGLKAPRWIVVNDDGTLYVSAHRLTSPDGPDRTEGRVVVRVDLVSGGMSEVATGLRSAEGLTRLNGDLIVASKGLATGSESAGALLRYPVLPGGALGTAATWVGSGLKQPVGVALDALGAVYVASRALTVETETSKRTIGKVHPDAGLTDFAANLSDPQGVALGHDGSLYVTDGKSGRLYRFRAPPPTTLDGLARFTRRPSIAITGTTESGARVDVFVNDTAHPVSGLADAAGHFAVNVGAASNTLNRLDVYAIARGGDGLASAAATAHITHDDRAPGVGFSAPPAGAHVRGLLSVSGGARDDGSGVASLMLSAAGRALSATLDRVPPAPTVMASAVWDTTTIVDGAQTLSVKATDAAGNESGAMSRSVIVDNTPPDTTITSAPGGDIAVSTATFTFTGADAMTPPADLAFAWRLDNGVWSAFASSRSVTLSGLAGAQHTFEVKARDRAGNEDPTPAARTFRVAFEPTLTAIMPSGGTAGTFVTISGSGFAPAPIAVTFNGAPALLRTVTGERITTTVPIGATTGPVLVTTPRGSTSGAFTVTPRGAFAFTALPAAATSLPGAQVSYTLGVEGSGAFTGLVSVGVSGLPAGVTAELLPGAFLAPGQSGELRLRLDPDAPASTTQLTITANATVDGIVKSQIATPTLTIGAGRTAVAGRFVLVSGERRAISWCWRRRSARRRWPSTPMRRAPGCRSTPST